MDKPTHCITGEEPQQPEYQQYHTDCPEHGNLLLLYDVLPHVRVSYPIADPSSIDSHGQARGTNNTRSRKQRMHSPTLESVVLCWLAAARKESI
jgi:hypothetical protein